MARPERQTLEIPVPAGIGRDVNVFQWRDKTVQVFGADEGQPMVDRVGPGRVRMLVQPRAQPGETNPGQRAADDRKPFRPHNGRGSQLSLLLSQQPKLPMQRMGQRVWRRFRFTHRPICGTHAARACG